MAHPHKSQAAESSRSKFKAITGHRGGGHAHAGGSHLKKPGAHGVHKTWSGHHKAHLLDGERSHGGRSKPRADKYARGGKVPREVNVTIQMPPAQGGAAVPPPPPAAPPPAPPSPPPGAAPPPPGGAMGGAGGPNPLNAAMGKGLGFKKGGRVAGGSKGTATNIVSKKRHESGYGRTDIGHGVKPAIGDTPYDLGHWAHYSSQGTPIKQGDRDYRARGGRMTAGAMSGVGRLEQYEHQRGKARRMVEGR